MGDRYFITVTCTCGITKEDVYYAPTCGFKVYVLLWDSNRLGKVHRYNRGRSK